MLIIVTLRYYKVFFVAPGPVSNIVNKTKFTSIDIMWGAPQNPNGVILRYEISYTVNDSAPVMFDITISNTIFTIPRLTPGTRVFISVRAYYSATGNEQSVTVPSSQNSIIC